MKYFLKYKYNNNLYFEIIKNIKVSNIIYYNINLFHKNNNNNIYILILLLKNILPYIII